MPIAVRKLTIDVSDSIPKEHRVIHEWLSGSVHDSSLLLLDDDGNDDAIGEKHRDDPVSSIYIDDM